MLKKIRPYQKSDKEVLMNMFRQHIPTYFAPEEEAHFEHFLDHDAKKYFVLTLKNEKSDEGEIVACGGFKLVNEKNFTKVNRVWDFVKNDEMNKGYMSFLTEYRLKQLVKKYKASVVYVRTSQFASNFYKKHSFVVETVVQDYWAKGFDLILMRKDLPVTKSK